MNPMIQSVSKTSRVAGPVIGLLMMSACAVGPNYKGPPDAAPLATAAGHFHRAAQAPVDAAPPPAQWWLALNDPELDRLIDRALRASPTVHEAQARLRSARAALTQQKTKLLPTGGANALEASARIPTGGLGVLASGQGGASGASAYDVNLYSVGFDATWELDIFGGVRRGVEAQKAQAEASEADLADAQVELTADVAQAYVNLRDAQRRLSLTRADRDMEQRMLDLTLQRRAAGTAADADVERLRAQAARTEADLAILAGQVEQSLDRIAVLAGAEPGSLDAELSAGGAPPTPPAQTPVGDPASLLRRRPDIRAAERRLAASNAQIGVNVAQLFPQVTLLGTLGFGGTDASRLFTGGSFTALGAPSLSWNILNTPRIQAQIRGAKAQRDLAEAQYEAAVLQALQDAETSLSRYGRQREDALALARAHASADRAAALTRRRFEAGTASLIDTLDTERQRVEAEESLSQAEATLTNDYIALQKSLGLGWGQPVQAAVATR
jgi:NodT family efflux transporter outer membrane factor (OMF) lipoprotein